MCQNAEMVIQRECPRRVFEIKRRSHVSRMSVFQIQGLSEERDCGGDQSEQPEVNEKAG